jgi:hypothetical protein
MSRLHEYIDRYPGLRGDETVTEQIHHAAESATAQLLLLELEDPSDTGSGLAAVVEDTKAGERRWVVETLAPPDDVAKHHRLLDVVLQQPDHPEHVYWRPPSSGLRMFPTPARATVDRTVLEMRGPVPSAFPLPAGIELVTASQLQVREGTCQRVAQRIVDMNNAAFADHPDQGELSNDDVLARMKAEWFDPDLLFIATDETGFDRGFVWLKHAADRPVELYVVGVIPMSVCSRSVRPISGLGRALVSRGLIAACEKVRSHVSVQTNVAGVLSDDEQVMLFVDANNVRAMSLYRSLGFAPVRRQDIVRLSTFGPAVSEELVGGIDAV